MSKITNVRLPDTSSTAVYDPQKFNQLVRSLEQIILQLNTTYTPITSENTLGALSWFEANGGQCEMNSGSSTPVSIGGTNVDAFGRLRVSEPYSLFDSQSRYAADNQFSTSTSGTGTSTFNTNQSSVSLAVTGGGVGSVVRQSFRNMLYQPGKGLLVLATFQMDNSTSANLNQSVGYFNTQNASSDANTLDDYEEGTWTPTITSDGGTITSSTFTNGLYTKIGRIVCVSGLVTLTNVGTASGNLQLTLPIASANDNWGGAGAEILAAGYQVAVCGSGGKLIIRKYDWSSLWTNNHGFRFTAVYPT